MNTETTTHTPGPWAYRQSSGTLSFTAKISDSDHNIPSIATIHDSAGRGEANTRLIAAAPELLEALFEVHQWSRRAERENQQSGPVLKDYLRQAAEVAREAIAKATGGAE